VELYIRSPMTSQLGISSQNCHFIPND